MRPHDIESLQNKTGIVLLIRHAERYPIDDMKDALQIRLTEKGHKDSRKLGTLLANFSPINIFHSPVPRCMETAQMIHEGLISTGAETSFSGDLMELGGPYVKGNWMELVKRTRTLGPSAFLREWFETDKHADIMVPLKEAAESSLAFLKQQLEETHSLVINVSHDWNVMILREYFFQLRHEDIGMPDFLDGLALYKENSSIKLKYHDREITIS